MQKVQHDYEDNNDTTWHSKIYGCLASVRLAPATPSREIMAALTMAAPNECKASLRKYCGRVNDPEIMGSSDSAMMWFRCMRCEGDR